MLAISKDEQMIQLKMLSSVDMFQKYPEVIRMLEEELSDGN